MEWTFRTTNEGIVGARVYSSGRMKKGKAYKETRDHVRVVEGLDYERLRQRSRSFRHFEGMLRWLVDGGRVYPGV